MFCSRCKRDLPIYAKTLCHSCYNCIQAKKNPNKYKVARKWYERNKEKLQVYYKEYYKKHKEELTEYHRQYHQANKDRINEYKKKKIKAVTIPHANKKTFDNTSNKIAS